MEQAVVAAGTALARVFDHVREELKKLKQTDAATMARTEALQADLTTLQKSHGRLQEEANQLESALNNERKRSEKLSASLLKAIEEFKMMQEGNDEILRQHNELVARVQKHENFQTTLQLLSSAAEKGSIVLKVQTTADGDEPSGSPLRAYRKQGNQLELSFAEPREGAAEQGTSLAPFKKPLPQKPSRGKRSGLDYVPNETRRMEHPMHGALRDQVEHNLQTASREDAIISSTTFHNSSGLTEMEKQRQQNNLQQDLAAVGSPVPVQSDDMEFNTAHERSTPVQETNSVLSSKRKRTPSKASSANPDPAPSHNARKASASTKRRKAEGQKSMKQQAGCEDQDDESGSEIVVAQRQARPEPATLDAHSTAPNADDTSSEGRNMEGLLSPFNITSSGRLTRRQPKNSPTAKNGSAGGIVNAMSAGDDDDAGENIGLDTSDNNVTYSQLRSQFQTRTGEMQKETTTFKDHVDATASVKQRSEDHEKQDGLSNVEHVTDNATAESGPKSRLRKQPAKSAKKRAQE